VTRSRYRHASAMAVCAFLAVAFFTAPGPASAAGAGTRPEAASESSLTAPELAALWKTLTTDLGPTTAASQHLLLGNRDPNGDSCVGPELGGTIIAHRDGGVGTHLAAIYVESIAERNSPMADFAWHQTRIKPVFAGLLTANRAVLAKVVRLATQSEELARALRRLAAWPQGLAASRVKPPHHWLGHCAGRLDGAMAQHDLAACKTWANELASATFALADLHRWINILVENQLTAIAFQARCKALFEECEEPYGNRYDATRHTSFFPGGRLTMNGLHNFEEVEHQAEWLFRVPSEYLELTGDGASRVKREAVSGAPAAVWLPPHLRGTFARLRDILSPANQEVWDRAAHSPFHRSYLANMLHRAWRVGAIERVAVVLKRFDDAAPRAGLNTLMDVLFYRGGDLGAGTVWDDRFDPHLMSAAGTLGGTDEQVLLGAQHFTRAVFGGWEHYGKAQTLREALVKKQFDCLRATDMVGTLYRNAGRAGYYSVRWCAGLAGHTVSAAEITTSGGSAIVIVDGLEGPETSTELWPYAYARGHAWPTGYTRLKADIYAVELYARGIDDYVWAEGFIVRGTNAGMLLRAFLPYLPNRAKPQTCYAHSGSHHARARTVEN